MNRLRWLFTAYVTRKYWIIDESPLSNEWHQYPNRDLRRHEACDCWCGPTSVMHDDDGDCWHVIHHSLDGREVRA